MPLVLGLVHAAVVLGRIVLECLCACVEGAGARASNRWRESEAGSAEGSETRGHRRRVDHDGSASSQSSRPCHVATPSAALQGGDRAPSASSCPGRHCCYFLILFTTHRHVELTKATRALSARACCGLDGSRIRCAHLVCALRLCPVKHGRWSPLCAARLDAMTPLFLRLKNKNDFFTF